MTPNPKIRELIMSMGIIPENEHYDIVERVVEQCIREVEGLQVDGRNEPWNRAIAHTALHLREHFGVEQ